MIISFVILTFFIVLDFIPVRYAIKEINDNYVFTYDLKTRIEIKGFAWTTTDEISGQRISLVANIVGEDPYDVLSLKEFNPDKLWSKPWDMKIVFYGETQKLSKDHKYDINVYSQKWDVVYPIQRTTFRRHYVSNEYLTIYDYNWINVLRKYLDRLGRS